LTTIILSLYKIQVILGKNFSTDPAQNGKEYIINESPGKRTFEKIHPKHPLLHLLGKHFGYDSL